MSNDATHPLDVAKGLISLIGQRAAGTAGDPTDHIAKAELEGSLQAMWNEAATKPPSPPIVGSDNSTN